MGGGKRLRPALCLWGYVAAGGDPDDEIVIDAGAACELMHASALFHDDVIDDAPRRRGLVTTHTVFADHHRQGDWGGEGRRFGEGMAILIGDVATAYGDQLVAEVNPVARSVWNEMRVEVNVGQILDVLGSARGVRDLAQAERICRYKSGKYSVERPLHLGAALAAPDRFDQLAPALSAYGLPLGEAFQMRDDVMGAFGDEAMTGKPVGGDLREGKPTPLLARALGSASPAQRMVLNQVGNPDLTDDEVKAIQDVIVATGALAELEATIAERYNSALAALQTEVITESARRGLAELAVYITRRTI
ncbi:MAG: polyprenyl synthetase [Ilumatobacter coccineus]|uniref:Polyprenyl synthetase n=1 Tax=Ilumatobacter coccineus TaxID=467094 RepID=A0A2G6K9C8_9ACTN|nr:MAG: polyprenyl synthetase [Ilumatobacter coccineus]